MEVSLEDLLRSRDQRAARQKELQKQHPGATLVSLTVVMPGQVKRNSSSLLVAGAALSALIARFGSDIIFAETRDLPTGYEAFLLTPLSEEDAKQAVCDIEETHPLGRLFDLDVIGKDGIPVSRGSVGRQPRRCLVCEREARLCMRSHAHTPEEIQDRIRQMIDGYVG